MNTPRTDRILDNLAVAMTADTREQSKAHSEEACREIEQLETELIKCREALDKLHIACETSKPEIYEWYLTDPFASEARENAIETLNQTK
jgi:hypothetical protein